MKERISGISLFPTVQERLEESEHKDCLEQIKTVLKGKTIKESQEILSFVEELILETLFI